MAPITSNHINVHVINVQQQLEEQKAMRNQQPVYTQQPQPSYPQQGLHEYSMSSGLPAIVPVTSNLHQGDRSGVQQEHTDQHAADKK